jgi:hypothetical protein
MAKPTSAASAASAVALVAAAIAAAPAAPRVRQEAMRILETTPPTIGRAGWPRRRADVLLIEAEASISARRRAAAEAAAAEEAAEVGWEVRRESGNSSWGFGPPWGVYRSASSSSTTTKAEARKVAAERNRREAGRWSAFIS